MKTKEERSAKLRDGGQCKVVGGVHEGKSGTVRDIKTGKTGHVSITVVQENGERFKTLARNVAMRQGASDADLAMSQNMGSAIGYLRLERLTACRGCVGSQELILFSMIPAPAPLSYPEI